MSAADPASWLVVEKGWDVVASDGEKVGTVHEVLGDRQTDIFDGLAVKPGLLGEPRYVPAERVAEIVQGEVRLDMQATEVERAPGVDSH